MSRGTEPGPCGRRVCPVFRVGLLVATPLLMLLVGWLARALGAPAYLLLLGPLMTACALLLLPSEIMLCVIGLAAMVAVVIGGGENTLAVGAGAVAVGVWVIPLYLLLARLRAERDNFALIRSLVSEIPGSLDPSSVLDAIVHTATESLGAKAASIRLLTEDERTLEIKATYGLSERYLAKGDVLLEESELDRRVLMGQVVCVRDAGHDDSLQYPEEAASEGIASVLCVPLCVRGRCGGVLRVYTEQPRDFTEAQASLLRTFAAVAAVALEQAHAHQGAVRYMRKAAHELRSPMCTVQTIVRGAAQGVTGDVDEQTRELLVRAANRVDGLLAVLDDLLSLSRMRMTPPSECEPVDLRDAVQAAVELHEPQAQEKGIDFRADVPSEPVLVRATVQHLEDLARNLISNAVKYTDEGGSVAITLTGTRGRARLTVADTGIGMSEEDVAELGAEFWRSKSARRSGAPGTGLGISIVNGLLERYGGRIDVDSEEGRGTTMTIELPMA